MPTVKPYPLSSAPLLAQLAESRLYRGIIERISAATQVEQGIIWGIGSRESEWGLSKHLKPQGPTGTGDWAKRPKSKYGAMPSDGLGWGRGLMQIDYAAHEFARVGNWRDPEANITYAIRGVLSPYAAYIRRNISGIDSDLLLRGAIAGYNCGVGRIPPLIKLGADVDKFTTGGNYSADVIARGKWFRDRGEWK